MAQSLVGRHKKISLLSSSVGEGGRKWKEKYVIKWTSLDTAKKTLHARDTEREEEKKSKFKAETPVCDFSSFDSLESGGRVGTQFRSV